MNFVKGLCLILFNHFNLLSLFSAPEQKANSKGARCLLLAETGYWNHSRKLELRQGQCCCKILKITEIVSQDLRKSTVSSLKGQMYVYFNLKRTAKYVNKLKTLSIALFQTKAKANTTKTLNIYFLIIQ